MYANPLAFRDLKNDSTITRAQREVQLEMENNRLFRGGDLLWDGVIIKNIEDMYDLNTLTNLGDSGTSTVVPAFLCGAQAIGVAYAKRWRSKEQTFDYGDKQGVAIDAIYGIEKMKFGAGSADTDDPEGSRRDHGLLLRLVRPLTGSDEIWLPLAQLALLRPSRLPATASRAT